MNLIASSHFFFYYKYCVGCLVLKTRHFTYGKGRGFSLKGFDFPTILLHLLCPSRKKPGEQFLLGKSSVLTGFVDLRK